MRNSIRTVYFSVMFQHFKTVQHIYWWLYCFRVASTHILMIFMQTCCWCAAIVSCTTCPALLFVETVCKYLISTSKKLIVFWTNLLTRLGMEIKHFISLFEHDICLFLCWAEIDIYLCVCTYLWVFVCAHNMDKTS